MSNDQTSCVTSCPFGHTTLEYDNTTSILKSMNRCLLETDPNAYHVMAPISNFKDGVYTYVEGGISCVSSTTNKVFKSFIFVPSNNDPAAPTDVVSPSIVDTISFTNVDPNKAANSLEWITDSFE